MKMILVPGFKELFPQSTLTYEKLLEDLPADMTISLLTSLNNELNTPENENEKQKRLIAAISYRFLQEQNEFLNSAYHRYRQVNRQYENHVFGRRYILSMLKKEVQINRTGNPNHDSPTHEFNFLLAYLHTVDEVNGSDDRNWGDLKEAHLDPLWKFKLLWTPNVNQFEFNKTDEGPFGIVKLLSLCKYAKENLHPYLKEYVNRYGFKNISQFIASYYQVANATLTYKPEEVLRKNNRIRPREGIDIAHLKSQAINVNLGKEITIADLRKYPLYQTADGDFRVIDEGMYYRKLYRGLFFELYHTTPLGKEKIIDFNDYSSTVSKKVLEEGCFNAVCKVLSLSKFDTLQFDDNSKTLPDAYYRHNKKILFSEFKDYTFPDALIAKPNFDKLKAYLDERFIESDKGKPKGITQLFNQLKLLRDGKYEFDEKLKHFLNNGKLLEIYPVICVSDFMFAIPGINEYLNDEFQRNIQSENWGRITIKPLTIITLENLFDYCYRNGNFPALMSMIDRYWSIMKDRTNKFNKERSSHHFLKSATSFDEMYNSTFLKELLSKSTAERKVFKLTDILGIKQEDLDEEL